MTENRKHIRWTKVGPNWYQLGSLTVIREISENSTVWSVYPFPSDSALAEFDTVTQGKVFCEKLLRVG
jgi:hypothetical protein